MKGVEKEEEREVGLLEATRDEGGDEEEANSIAIILLLKSLALGFCPPPPARC